MTAQEKLQGAERITVSESSAEDMECLRWLLDLSLQPLAGFEGFTRMEQIGGSALRYQLNFIQYALAMSQYTRTPAFTGYLQEAQQNCIRKMCDKRVWGYWAWENLLGYGRWNPDPIVHQNVMYSGFFAVMLGFYETLNDDVFSQSDSLTLKWNEKKEFVYDYKRVATALRRNMVGSKYTQFACEPHLVYPMCNTFSLNGMYMHDRLHGSQYLGDLVERVQESYDEHEFLREDGRFLMGRGPGFAMPPVLGNDAVMSFWLHALMPEQSRASWELVRNKLTTVENGSVKFKRSILNRVDFGNYRLNDAWMRACLLTLAREMGDAEFAQAIESDFSRDYPLVRQNGARAFAGVSSWANAKYALARFTRENSLHDLLHGHIPQAWKEGPLLSAAAYPDVLVAKAVSDGKNLELVLLPGMADGSGVQTRLGFSRLRPGARYLLQGQADAAVMADTEGCAELAVTLSGRTEIRLALQS